MSSPFQDSEQIRNGGLPTAVSQLRSTGERIGFGVFDEEFAHCMDEEDPLRQFRKEFYYPKMKDLNDVDLSLVDPDEDCVYLTGHSLGLCPVKTKEYVGNEIEKWATKAVQGHFCGDLPWALCAEVIDSHMAVVIGAQDGEVALMNGLSVNLHLMLISFYRPTPERHKIVIEAKAFPSDHYAMQSQIRLHGYDPDTSLICIAPREGEEILRLEDILAVIETEGESVAVVCLPGVQYYTGQLFDIPTITKAGQEKGCYVGWDLAHAAGNVQLQLHDWGVDFAAWCTYKYMNSGAGGLAAVFIHEKHFNNDFPKLQGWWAHRRETRFNMDNNMDPCPGAYAYRISNTPGLLCAALWGSLELFSKTSMSALARKSRLLTGYLEMFILEIYGEDRKIKDAAHPHVKILTPDDPQQRGSQLSLTFPFDVKSIGSELHKRGVICDIRLPHVIRIAPVPFYCSFHDVFRFMKYLDQAIKAIVTESNDHDNSDVVKMNGNNQSEY